MACVRNKKAWILFVVYLLLILFVWFLIHGEHSVGRIWDVNNEHCISTTARECHLIRINKIQCRQVGHLSFFAFRLENGELGQIVHYRHDGAYCVTDQGNGKVDLELCNGNDNQNWLYKNYQLVSMLSKLTDKPMCITSQHGIFHAGSSVALKRCIHNAKQQKWNLEIERNVFKL